LAEHQDPGPVSRVSSSSCPRSSAPTTWRAATTAASTPRRAP